MNHNFNLDTLRKYYSSLLEYICSDRDFLKLCTNISNIWKTTDQKFLQLMGSFFAKQPDAVKSLIPSSKLYSEIISFCGKNNDKELLKWVKSFNNNFLSSVAMAIKKNKSENSSCFEFNEYLRKCSDVFYKLKTQNEYLEKIVAELKDELKLAQDKNAFLTSSIEKLENLADQECENFRKRMRSGIYSLNVDESTTV